MSTPHHIVMNMSKPVAVAMIDGTFDFAVFLFCSNDGISPIQYIIMPMYLGT